MNGFNFIQGAFLSVKQMMTKFDVSRRTVENWMHQGLESFRMGKRVYFTNDAIAAFAKCGGRISSPVDHQQIERELEAIGV